MIHKEPETNSGRLDNLVVQAVERAWPATQWCEIHVVLAVSGGADSMGLLRAMHALKSHHGGKGQLHVVHIDHRLRKTESQADANWLSQQCDLLEIPITIYQVDVSSFASIQGDGIEAAARDQRYRLLTQHAEQIGARFVVTGHTSNDQVETVLFRLLRGSGLRGLSGIRASRPLSPAVTLMRPLLGCWREELTDYLDELNQTFRWDSSNQQNTYSRNRIRLDLLPQLRSDYNQQIDSALIRLADQAAATEQFLETQASHLLDECDLQVSPRLLESQQTPAGPSLTLRTAPLAKQPAILVCETLRLAWRQASLPEQGMTHHWWQKLALLTQTTKSQVILVLPGDIRATFTQSHLVLSPSK